MINEIQYLNEEYKKEKIKYKELLEKINQKKLRDNMLPNFTNNSDAITLFGNPIPTKNLIVNIKKYGFKTIRFPVTWIYFIDQSGNINPEWILRVKEVVKWIIEKNIYCILTIYADTKEWIIGIDSKDKYINIWKQIAEEFKDFNEYLIFESMNEPTFLFLYDYNYDTLLNFTQSFVDTIRNSEKFNKERLLIISGMNSNIDLTCSERYKMPNDPANKFAISINYYIPVEFATSDTYWFNNKNYWGTRDDYKELLTNFNQHTNNTKSQFYLFNHSENNFTKESKYNEAFDKNLSYFDENDFINTDEEKFFDEKISINANNNKNYNQKKNLIKKNDLPIPNTNTYNANKYAKLDRNSNNSNEFVINSNSQSGLNNKQKTMSKLKYGNINYQNKQNTNFKSQRTNSRRKNN